MTNGHPDRVNNQTNKITSKSNCRRSLNMDNKVSKKFQDDEKRKDGSNSKITIKEFDDLFKYIGGIGPFQVCHILFIGRFSS